MAQVIKPTSLPKEQLANDRDRMLKALKEALAGLGGQVYSSLIMFPMDVVKIRMQVPGNKYSSMMGAFSTILSEEGFSAMYTGLSSELLKSGIQTFLYYYCYSAMKDSAKAAQAKDELTKKLQKMQATATALAEAKQAAASSVKPASKSHTDLPVWVGLAIGIMAGIITQTFVNPLSVIQTRIMTSKKSGGGSQGVFSTGLAIVKEEGFLALYKGLIPTFILCSNPAINNLVFDRLKSFYVRWLYQRQHPRNPNMMEIFVMGAISKVVSTIVTYPYIMAKVRLQWKGNPGEAHVKYNGTIDVITKILQHEGFFGLFAGIQPQLMKSVLSGAMLMMAKEKIQDFADLFVEAIHRMTSPAPAPALVPARPRAFIPSSHHMPRSASDNHLSSAWHTSAHTCIGCSHHQQEGDHLNGHIAHHNPLQNKQTSK